MLAEREKAKQKEYSERKAVDIQEEGGITREEARFLEEDSEEEDGLRSDLLKHAGEDSDPQSEMEEDLLRVIDPYTRNRSI